jgi:hypothetical protein
MFISKAEKKYLFDTIRNLQDKIVDIELFIFEQDEKKWTVEQRIKQSKRMQKAWADRKAKEEKNQVHEVSGV